MDDLTIALEGSNRIAADDAAFDDFFTTWRGDSKGIFVDGAAFTVSGSGSLTVNSGEGASSYGIYAQGVTIKDGAAVQATAGDSDASSTGGARYSVGIYIVVMLFALAGIAAIILGKKNSRIAK